MEQHATAEVSSSSSGLSALVKAANELFQVGKRSLNWLKLPSLPQARHHVFLWTIVALGQG